MHRDVSTRLKDNRLACFYATPEGMKDIGYLGNVPIAGDYSGPTEQAYAHLDSVLKELGLSEFAYKEELIKTLVALILNGRFSCPQSRDF